MNAYQILQVSNTAPIEVIRAAWSALVRQCHPDGPKPDKLKTQRLNEAYAVLKDPAKRAALDQQLAAHANGNGKAKIKHAPRVVDPHPPESAYPDAYVGFSPEKIDEAITELTRAAGAPPIVGDFMQFLHQQARRRQ